MQPKRIYIAATRQNEGKTTISLGLIFALKKRYGHIGFIKPVGQRYVEMDGHKIDEDSVLVDEVCRLDCPLQDMSPVAVERGFTEAYVQKPDLGPLEKQIMDSFHKVSEGKDLVIIEGTGHAGVGAVFDLCNATVAKMLEAPALIVSGGGIGRPIDEIVLNKALFDREGVKVAGAIFNRVQPDKLEKIQRLGKMGLERQGIDLVGAIPHRPSLECPTVRQVMEELGCELVHGEEWLDNPIESTVVGAMTPHQALDHFGTGVLVITPGDREDLILAAMSSCVVGVGKAYCVAGIVLTGGLYPHRTVLRLIKRVEIPVLASPLDTYTVATEVRGLTVKIRPNDKAKITTVARLIERHVDIDRILAAVG